MEKTALIRDVSSDLENCALTFVDRLPIDWLKAAAQHREYGKALSRLGVAVTTLEALPGFADGVFVEDPAVVFDELAVMTRMGTESRQGEVGELAKSLKAIRSLVFLETPATLEGGDVLRIGQKVFVGTSKRTNRVGAEQLKKIIAPLGYQVITSEVKGCLHFKTGCSYLGKNTVLINSTWIDPKTFDGFTVVEVDSREPFAANALLIGDTVVYSTSFVHTQNKLEKLGFKLELVDISELMKAEAGLTCLSQIFG